MPIIRLSNKELFVSLFFDDTNLAIVEIAFSLDPSAKTWEDWSYEQEMENKQFHDALLKEDLGDPPYTYWWGVLYRYTVREVNRAKS